MQQFYFSADLLMKGSQYWEDVYEFQSSKLIIGQYWKDVYQFQPNKLIIVDKN